MDKHMIIGVHVTERLKRAGQIQEVLTKFGDTIKTRIGLHDVTAQVSSPNGVLILECIGDDDRFNELQTSLKGIEGVEVKTMVFSH